VAGFASGDSFERERKETGAGIAPVRRPDWGRKNRRAVKLCVSGVVGENGMMPLLAGRSLGDCRW